MRKARTTEMLKRDGLEMVVVHEPNQKGLKKEQGGGAYCHYCGEMINNHGCMGDLNIEGSLRLSAFA